MPERKERRPLSHQSKQKHQNYQNQVKSNYEKCKEATLTTEGMPCLQTSFYVAEKVGESVGRSKILQ